MKNYDCLSMIYILFYFERKLLKKKFVNISKNKVGKNERYKNTSLYFKLKQNYCDILRYQKIYEDFNISDDSI